MVRDSENGKIVTEETEKNEEEKNISYSACCSDPFSMFLDRKQWKW